jgi:hypothetical protein
MRTSLTSPATAFQRMDYLREEMERTRGLYLGAEGEERAGYASQLAGLISEYMGMAQEVYQRPSPEYQQIYDEMNSWLEEIRGDAAAFAATEEDLLKQISDIDTEMAEDIKAFKEEAAQYYQWAMEEGNRLYAEAIAEQTEKLAAIIGDKTVEEYLADLQEQAVTQLEKIKSILKRVLEALLPGVPIEGYASGGYASRPTLTWVAEKEPEWIIPQSKMGQVGSTQSITIAPNITIQASGKVDAGQIAKATEEAIIKSFKYGKGRQVLKEAMSRG